MSDPVIVEEETGDSVRETVEAAYDRIEEAGNDPAPDVDPVVVADPDAEPIVAADTDPVIDPDAEPVVDPNAEPATDPATDPAAVAAEAQAYPEHWDPAFKEEFEAQTPASQKFLLDRHKAMEADYTRKNMETSDLKRDYGPLKQILAPFGQLMQDNNIPPAELVRRWAVAENHLNTDPEQAITQLAAHYGVDIVGLADKQFQQNPNGQPAQQAVDPRFQNLEQQVTSLQNTISNQQTTGIEQSLNTFAEEVTEAGTPAHPYFDEVIPDMMQLLSFERAQGRNPGINDLYDKACRMNTSVFDKMTASQQTADAAVVAANKATEEARLKAQRAKDAASSVDGDPGSAINAVPNAPDSIRGAVNDAWDKTQVN